MIELRKETNSQDPMVIFERLEQPTSLKDARDKYFAELRRKRLRQRFKAKRFNAVGLSLPPQNHKQVKVIRTSTGAIKNLIKKLQEARLTNSCSTSSEIVELTCILNKLKIELMGLHEAHKEEFEVVLRAVICSELLQKINQLMTRSGGFGVKGKLAWLLGTLALTVDSQKIDLFHKNSCGYIFIETIFGGHSDAEDDGDGDDGRREAVCQVFFLLGNLYHRSPETVNFLKSDSFGRLRSILKEILGKEITSPDDPLARNMIYFLNSLFLDQELNFLNFLDKTFLMYFSKVLITLESNEVLTDACDLITNFLASISRTPMIQESLLKEITQNGLFLRIFDLLSYKDPDLRLSALNFLSKFMFKPNEFNYIFKEDTVMKRGTMLYDFVQVIKKIFLEADLLTMEKLISLEVIEQLIGQENLGNQLFEDRELMEAIFDYGLRSQAQTRLENCKLNTFKAKGGFGVCRVQKRPQEVKNRQVRF